MNINYFELTTEEKIALIQQAGNQLNIADAIIEKDLWICWVLDVLFSMPLKMAFKGGTSLSKVFNLIARFSEDVDVTIDYRNFEDALDLSSISGSQLKKFSARIKVQLKETVHTQILPYIQQRVAEVFHNQQFSIETSNDGGELHFYYPSVLTQELGYLREHVLIEFGMRNSIEPHEHHRISPLLALVANSSITFHTTDVEVLSPVRTFWEKATLMHVECNRPQRFPPYDVPFTPRSVARLSRHWYDLFMLSQSTIRQQALVERMILESVIEHKSAFYNSSYANYEVCLTGGLRLIPESEVLKLLADDYSQMQQAGMFQNTPPTFTEIINSLKKLEETINALMKKPISPPE